MYRNLPNYVHKSVMHSVREYVNEQASTNGIESFWALLKSGYYGTHHWWSVKHLHRYVNEYTYRHNTRHLTRLLAISNIVERFVGKRLTYAELIS